MLNLFLKKKRQGVNEIQMWGSFAPLSSIRWEFTASYLVMGRKDSIEWESVGDRMYSAASHSAISWQ